MRSTDRLDGRVKLLAVANVQPGYLSREGVRPAANGTHYLLQARDVSPAAGIRPSGLIRFRPQRQPELYKVSHGDILIASRGRDHLAYLVEQELSDTLASYVFYIVRPNVERVLPAYLAWWLNLPHVQAKIDSGTRGTGIGYIARQTLEQLPIVVPPARLQSRIADVLHLSQRQRALQTQLELRRDQLINAICQQAVQIEKE